MLIKMLSCQGKATTLEEYKAAVRGRAKLWWGVAALGVLTLAATLFLMGGAIADAPDTAHLEGFWCGVGAGLILAGVILALRTRALLKDDARLRRAQLEEQDERNQAVASRALGLTAFALLVGMYAALLVASFINMTVFYTLVWCVASALVLFLIFRAVCSRRM